MARQTGNIRGVLRSYSVLLVLLPFTLLSIPFFFLAKTHLQNANFRHVEAVLDARAAGLEDWLDGGRRTVALLADAVGSGSVAEEASRRLFETAKADFAFADLALTDAEGVRLAPGGAGAPRTEAEAPWFGRLRRGEAVMAEEADDAPGGAGGGRLVLAAPAVGPDGRFLGAVVARLELAAAAARVEEFRIGRTGGVFLLDGRGRVLAAPAREAGLRGAAFDAAWLESVLRGAGTDAPRGGPVRLGGQEALVIGAPVASGLLLLAGQADDGEALEAVLTLSAFFLACFLCALLVVTPAGLAISRRIERPVRLLAEAASGLREGRFDAVLDARGFERAPLELRELRQSFESMRQALAEHIRLLEISTATDQLTGVANRRLLVLEGARLVGAAVRAGQPCACLMIDIDRFKQVNDAHGHMVGDAVLRHVCAVIAQTVRQSDLLARYGGEEFCVIAPNADQADALALAERIRSTVAETPLVLKNLSLTRTVSVGVSEYSLEPSFGTNLLEDMIEKADMALYAAKNGGRNRVELFDPERIGAPRSAA